ncbi:YitT family protein [Clostridium manihotivorum]|uniref:YitT family protein n=1 Tax=Clostridium manihotivorum TaxID=2320868 RepID=A0A410DZN7_9CLOT|nr:YitT family protein [Clostridium manihotivorum]QAA34513.1 YitT family protein [Clostridium manihotivorum]
MLKKYYGLLKNIALILLGNTIYALAVTIFILPSGLITGGTTGLALLFYHQLGVPITIFVSIFNISMFILGALVLGKKFALTTLISTFYYPLILGVFQKIPSLQGITSDHLLSTIYAGIMIGFSIGIVIKAGASTGGMDIPPLVLNKKFGFPVSVVMYGLDFTILLSQMLFANKEQVLYGMLLVLIYTVVLDKILLLGQSRTQVKIVSEKYEEINQMIIKHLDRGSTLIHAETGYCHNNNLVVLTVISNRELPKLNEMVLSIDPKAFMIINRVNEVKGRGFTMDKIYK